MSASPPWYSTLGERALWYRLNAIESKLNALMAREGEEMATVLEQLAGLDAKVSAQTTVIGSTKTLLEQLNAALKNALALGDPVAIASAVQGISDHLDANTSTLSDAVVANTPAA